jgi:hypothetical protein
VGKCLGGKKTGKWVVEKVGRNSCFRKRCPAKICEEGTFKSYLKGSSVTGRRVEWND